MEKLDVLICGSGCAGSLLAWILARQGLRVLLVDRARHPRFAIGESSTPLADFLLEQISDEFGLNELKPLSRWGSWQATYPQLRAGKKRGFSYYGHPEGQHHNDDSQHSESLLVSASVDDSVSDTHWFRADVDQWLCQQAVASGVGLLEEVAITGLMPDVDGWKIEARRHDELFQWRPEWIVDATGIGGIVPRAMGIKRIDDELLTQTGSLFGHFTNVGSMTQWIDCQSKQHPQLTIEDDPFDGDDSAQHHVLIDGWVWILRFACGITSVGFTRPTQIWQQEGRVSQDLPGAWQDMLQRYPTLQALLDSAELVGPTQEQGLSDDPRSKKLDGGANLHAKIGWMPRLSRLWSQAAGNRWLALPSTVGVIDPLHSTGIAHALSGVQRAARLLLCPAASQQQQQLAEYSQDVVDEVRWIDRLVSTCYAGLPDFELFAAACSFYFIAAHTSETELRDTRLLPHGFLGWKRQAWQDAVQHTAARLHSRNKPTGLGERAGLVDSMRRAIEPWNQIGLLWPGNRNRLARSATKLTD